MVPTKLVKSSSGCHSTCSSAYSHSSLPSTIRPSIPIDSISAAPRQHAVMTLTGSSWLAENRKSQQAALSGRCSPGFCGFVGRATEVQKGRRRRRKCHPRLFLHFGHGLVTTVVGRLDCRKRMQWRIHEKWDSVQRSCSQTYCMQYRCHCSVFHNMLPLQQSVRDSGYSPRFSKQVKHV